MRIDSDQWRQAVVESSLALGVTVSADQARTMGRHAQELLQWNRVTNLTAITDPLEVAVKHYADSLAAVSWIDKRARVLDAGSGGGFPGVPLAILRPDLTVTLVDSVRKKVSFLNHIIRTLSLNCIDAVQGRLEDLGRQPRYRGRFDLVVCRAFSSLTDFVDRALPLLSPGGRLLAMKGRQAAHDFPSRNLEDCKTIVLAGASLSLQIHQYRLPILDAQRHLVILTPLPRREAIRAGD